jgi:DNA-binding MltR family transcriptional regulator
MRFGQADSRDRWHEAEAADEHRRRSSFQQNEYHLMWLTLDSFPLDAIDELEASSDRAAGIIAGTIIDSHLYEVLGRCLCGQSEAYSAKVRKNMFSPDGALGGFGTRANLAYLMGLIGEDAHADLQNFAKIRNSFAHHSKHNSFETESIRSRCFNFKLVDSRVSQATMKYQTVSGEQQIMDAVAISPGRAITLYLVDPRTAKETAKGRFIATSKLFCAAFSHFAESEDRAIHQLI